MTQKPSKHGAILAAAILALGGAFASSSLSAQTVVTNPVGAVTKTVNVGLNSVGITLLNPDLVVANASANDATSITLSGVTNVGSLLTTGTLYYVEAISGALEGDRFDVDTAATITAANGNVVLNAASANNTVALTDALAVGTQFALRKHVTLSQVQSYLQTPVGNNTAGSADQIWLLNSAGTAFAQYYLRADGVAWRLIGGNTTDVSKTVVIPPGTGIMIQKRTAASSLVMTGGVRVNDFAMNLPLGLSFRAPGYPISQSAASLGGTSANGWTGNNIAGSADQLRILNGAGNNFTAYYLRGDGTNWRLIGGNTTNLANDLLFTYDSGFLVARKAADNDNILISPIAL